MPNAAAATLAWPCRLSTERFNGSYQTASHEAHGPASDASKSQYGEEEDTVLMLRPSAEPITSFHSPQSPAFDVWCWTVHLLPTGIMHQLTFAAT